MRAAPAKATGMATRTTRDGLSCRKRRERTMAKTGDVFTSRTDEATVVYERLAIHVAKWRARAVPAATTSSRCLRSRAGQERRASPDAKGSRSREAIATR